jgi:hypothetical protein
MKILRWVLAGIAVGVISEIFGWLIYGCIFHDYCALSEHIWRPMDDPCWKIGMPLTDILNGLMIALGYAIFYKGIPGEGLRKGLNYGVVVWLISRFAGEIFFYVMIPIHRILIFAGWLHGILTLCLGGIVIAAIYGKSLEK